MASAGCGLTTSPESSLTPGSLGTVNEAPLLPQFRGKAPEGQRDGPGGSVPSDPFIIT